MRLYHVTNRANLAPIMYDGILASKSRGVRKAVWLISRRLLAWAIIHLCKRDGFTPQDLCVIEVGVDPMYVIGGWRQGMWRLEEGRDVFPEELIGSFAATAAPEWFFAGAVDPEETLTKP